MPLFDPKDFLDGVRRAGSQEELEIAVAKMIEETTKSMDATEVSKASRVKVVKNKELCLWICKCSIDDRDVAKRFKFQWNPERKFWFTESEERAEQMIQWLDACKEKRDVDE